MSFTIKRKSLVIGMLILLISSSSLADWNVEKIVLDNNGRLFYPLLTSVKVML